MNFEYNRKLVLKNGEEYYGYGFGSVSDRIAEVVFNTSMVGYQEILSDPSYTDQGVVMTYPVIGNYGMAEDDYETSVPTIGALIVREYTAVPSNFRSTASLEDIMLKYGIPGICGVDTRRLTRAIRNTGSQPGLLTRADMPLNEAMELLDCFTAAKDAVARVSCEKAWVSPASAASAARVCRKEADETGKAAAAGEADETGSVAAPAEIYHVAAVDCGMKLNIVRSLNLCGCKVTVLPWNTSADEIRSLKPDGIFLSNGPGDPEDVAPLIETVRALRGQYPIFGICLGHQILSLAYGARTYKLKFGHRGGNHPVRNLLKDTVEITSQNHSYAVDIESLSGTPLEITHVNLLDGTVEGVRCEKDFAFGVQYHPESAPGPQDSGYLFREFIGLMEEYKHAKAD